MVDGIVKVVNIIPQSMSGEANQDSEPNLAVNPADVRQMVATAFTPPPMGGANAPIFVSTDGGSTWSLRNVVPGNNASGFPTLDISVSFGTTGSTLYAAILRGDDPARRMQILRSPGFAGTAAMVVLSDRTGPDQPWVVSQNKGNADRLWVGNNDLGSGDQTAVVDATANARAATPTFARTVLETRETSGQDGPPVRLAANSDGTVYAAFVRWSHAVGNNKSFDIVLTRDDQWGTGATPFTDLVDASDHLVGARIASDLYAYFGDTMGQERLGADIALAVDPNDSSTVWLAWGYKYGGVDSSIPWAVDIARSTGRGASDWKLIKTVLRAKNPALAVNSQGVVAFLYQEWTDDTDEWVTRLELTTDEFADTETHVLHRAPSGTPASTFLPYLGDYVRMVSVGRSFYGVFSGSNVPDMAHFPSGVTYQRNADWTANNLLGVDGMSFVSPSIDPFFFSWRPGTLIHPGPVITPPQVPQVPKVPPGPPGTIIPRISRLPIEVPDPPTDLEL